MWAHCGRELTQRMPSPEKPNRDFSKVLANGNGVGWAELGMKATIWKLHLGSMPCSLDSTLFHVSASTALGWRRAASAVLTTDVFQTLPFLFIGLFENTSEGLSLSLPNAPRKIFMWKCEHKNRTLTYLILQQQTRKRNSLAAVCL